VAGTILRTEASEASLVSLMFEKKLALLEARKEHADAGKEIPLLELKGVSTKGEGLGISLKGIDLQIFPGEIVGVAGVSGNGQKELGDTALGMIRIQEGRKYLSGDDFTRRSVQELRQSGVAYIPENPLTMSIAPFMTVLQNMALTRAGEYARLGGFRMDWQAVRADVEATSKSLGYSFPLYVPARSLSGGNLQRMVIVREMAGRPRLIIASYLTRGLDVQSTIAARQALLDARANGAGVLLISEDLEELFTLSDRLIVLYGGVIAGSFKPEDTTVFEVGHLITGTEIPHGKNN
jgi:simple sugar transport system ATP-binding protein